jgi:hypothetical protein
MRQDGAKELSAGIFETGDRVSHDEHGDGIVTGTYGTKLAVDFDNVGTKRISVESLSRAPWTPPETLKALLAERDAQRAAARAAYGLVPAPVVPTPKQQRRSAEIIPFPAHRIVRRIQHGKAAIVPLSGRVTAS